MKKVAICNVGERDVRYNVTGRFLAFGKGEGEELAGLLGCRKGARHLGKRILEIMEGDREALKRLRFPIIEPFLEYVIDSRDALDLLVLVVTDQRGAEESFTARDTVNSGQILKRLVRGRFGGKIDQVRLLKILSFPHLLEEAYEVFSTRLPQIMPLEEEPEVHVLSSGGVPALNYGLPFKALALYGKDCHVYQVEEPPRTDLLGGGRGGEVKPADMLKIHRDLLLNMGINLVENYDYNGALAVLEGLSYRLRREIRSWLKCAALRLNLNHEEARDQLATLETPGPLLRSWYEWLREPNSLKLLIEILWVASICYERGSYSDLLWRATAFHENALGLIAAGGIGRFGLESEDEWSRSEVERQDPELFEYLEDSKGVSRAGEDSWWANRHFFEEVCEYVCNVKGREKWIPLYEEYLSPLDRLWHLRNEVLHNLEGVDRSTISKQVDIPHRVREEIAPEEGVEDVDLLIPLMKVIVSRLGELMGREILEQNPYQQMNAYLLRGLREQMTR